ncbi:MAG TPA: hypothetical protein VFF69_04320 [Phycisphaerales bacterium]|nr:hypothetical protein [Phycisphaerales bacterium]
MNARGWFTLVVKGIGLWAVVFGAAGLVEAYFGRPSRQGLAFMGAGGPPLMTTSDIRSMADELVWLVAGAYLLFGGKLLINGFCAEVVGRCPKCRYDLAGVASGAKCPECGAVRE